MLKTIFLTLPRVILQLPLIGHKPLLRDFGFSLGTPVDRVYIERFLEDNAHLIRGRVMEIGDSRYSDKFGRSLESVDILHIDEENEEATIGGNLLNGEGIPSGRFDTVICTQTLHCLPDPVAGLRNLQSSLAPGGVLLATLPLLAQISRFDMDTWGDYWRFTSKGAVTLFSEVFKNQISVHVYGNFRSAVAFLSGIPGSFLSQRSIWANDPDYEVLIGVVARNDSKR